MHRTFGKLTYFFLVVASLTVLAQDKKQPEEPPRLLLSTPLGATAGESAKILLRGLQLDQASEVRIGDPPLPAKILSKAKVAVPQKQVATRAGDTQVEVEFTLPKTIPPGEIAIVVVGPTGTSAAYSLFVDDRPPVTEQEPNDGFAQAQPIEIGATVEGTLHQPQNVDVFRFAGQAGEKLVCEIIAARRGSALDATLTLFDARRRLIDTADDLPADAKARDEWSLRDARLEITLPATGAFFLVLQDANDFGGPAHPYRLRVVRVSK
jgi:hypothetical protein